MSLFISQGKNYNEVMKKVPDRHHDITLEDDSLNRQTLAEQNVKVFIKKFITEIDKVEQFYKLKYSDIVKEFL